ncbi:hypothetical protein KR009_000171, partial [Drosophila setifemur]
RFQFICLSSSPDFVSADRGVFACHCILLKECGSFVRILLHHGAGERSAVFAKVQAASCGFQGLEPLVCCHFSRKSHRNESPPVKLGRMLRFAPPNERWIWDDGGDNKGKGRHSQPKSPPAYHEMETSLHDYWDFKEHRNCPQPVEPEFFDHRFGGAGHHFHYHVEHGIGDTLTPRPNPVDKPIVFPGDLRFLRQGEEEPNLEGPPLAPFTTSTSTPPASTTTITNTLSIPSSSPSQSLNLSGCGISVESRLLGGEQARAGQYPWLARIGYRNRTSSRMSYRCSGSLISSNYILTAAHCVVNLVRDLELSHVRLGDEEAVTRLAIGQILVHPNYDLPRYSNDIALLRLNTTTGRFLNSYFFSYDIFSYSSPGFTPICLPLNASSTLGIGLIGQTGVAAGWSTMSPESESRNSFSASIYDNGSSTGVRFIRLPIVNTSSCAQAYARLSQNFQQPIVITLDHLCAQGQAMNDVCRGDSGGPFMDDGTSGLFGARGRHTIIGIVAFGPTLCGVTTIPGVYTLVSSFSDWILQSIRGGA